MMMMMMQCAGGVGGGGAGGPCVVVHEVVGVAAGWTGGGHLGCIGGKIQNVVMVLVVVETFPRLFMRHDPCRC